MAYFSNATEGERWKGRNCDKCIHEPNPDSGKDCPILLLHDLHNYDRFPGNRNSVARADAFKICLDALIPMDGMYAGQCNMLVEKENV